MRFVSQLKPKKVGHLLAILGRTHCLCIMRNEDRTRGICCIKQINPRFIYSLVSYFIKWVVILIFKHFFCKMLRFRSLDSF
jgi:hypothetical protein